jgi:N-acyl-D-amino-acid deacylase
VRSSRIKPARYAGLLLIFVLARYLCANNTIPISGWPKDKLTEIDDIMVKFMKDNNTPGASLCIAKGGRIVFCKGFGYANLETSEPVTTKSQFRIGSISKPITAVMIMVLSDKGILKLNEHPFSILDYEPFLQDDAHVDQRIYNITILNLLQHTGGWDLSKTFDPTGRIFSIGKEMGLKKNAEGKDLVQYMLGMPLQYDPGKRYAYSNFGYVVLGMVIEKKTGLTYTEAVEKYVFEPLSLQNIDITSDQLEGKSKNEVIYYDSESRTVKCTLPDGKIVKVPYPYYKPHVPEFTAAGGWMSNAEDMVKFALALDNPRTCKILRPYYIKRMFAIPKNIKWLDDDGETIQRYSYACGWKVKDRGKGKFDIWHHGSRPGASSGLMMTYDGYVYSVLFNTRNNSKGEKLSYIFFPVLNKTLAKIKEWPEYK